jgi:ribose transport system ATP-binding protein
VRAAWVDEERSMPARFRARVPSFATSRLVVMSPQSSMSLDSSTTPLFSMNSVSKRFGATLALDRVSFAVDRGEIRSLIGENGAGTSTLMRLLAGVHAPDEGAMELDGAPFAPASPAAARTAGIAMIHQELSIAPDLSVEANVMLGRERSRGGFTRQREQRRIARECLARLAHVEVDPDARAGDLPIALQQQVEIARALASDARVIVLDEPTSSLGREDCLRLFAVVRELAEQGLGVVYISHFLEEVQEVCGTYTVLRDGRVASHGRMRETSLDAIVRDMVGRELVEMFPHAAHTIDTTRAPLLEVRGLCGVRAPRDAALVLHRGEILGLAGLVGAGRSELLRCIFGLDAVRAGSVRVVANERARDHASKSTPRESIARGLGFVSEDRKREGLALDLSIEDNITLTALERYARFGWLALRRRRSAAREWIERARVRARSSQQPVRELSGGNQQKVAIARLLHQDADVYLLDEPTRGIDVGTKSEIYRWIGELAQRGKGVLLASSYLPELMNVCDTIAVMCRGEIVDVRAAREWTEAEVMLRATGAARVREEPR